MMSRRVNEKHPQPLFRDSGLDIASLGHYPSKRRSGKSHWI